jgi:hypothetical protein
LIISYFWPQFNFLTFQNFTQEFLIGIHYTCFCFIA